MVAFRLGSLPPTENFADKRNVVRTVGRVTNFWEEPDSGVRNNILEKLTF